MPAKTATLLIAMVVMLRSFEIPRRTKGITKLQTTIVQNRKP